MGILPPLSPCTIYGSGLEEILKWITYTSNRNGIRHAMLEEANLSYIYAEFRLVVVPILFII